MDGCKGSKRVRPRLRRQSIPLTGPIRLPLRCGWSKHLPLGSARSSRWKRHDFDGRSWAAVADRFAGGLFPKASLLREPSYGEGPGCPEGRARSVPYLCPFSGTEEDSHSRRAGVSRRRPEAAPWGWEGRGAGRSPRPPPLQAPLFVKWGARDETIAAT